MQVQDSISYSYTTPHKANNSSTRSANQSEDWTKISNLAERRRIQNRISQRTYREKLKGRLLDLERRVSRSPPALAEPRSAGPETRIPAHQSYPASPHSSPPFDFVQPARRSVNVDFTPSPQRSPMMWTDQSSTVSSPALSGPSTPYMTAMFPRAESKPLWTCPNCQPAWPESPLTLGGIEEERFLDDGYRVDRFDPSYM